MQITTVNDLRIWADGLLGDEQTDEQTERLVNAVHRQHVIDPDAPDFGEDWGEWIAAIPDDTLVDWAENGHPDE